MNPKEPKPTSPIVDSVHTTSDLPLKLPTVISAADPPFDKGTDLILQTTDHFQFHVWKCILAEASPVFGDMFALGQGQLLSHSSYQSGAEPSDSKGTQTSLSHPSVPIVEVLEDSVTLRLLLQRIYPPSPGRLVGTSDLKLGDLKPILAAAHKYQMDGVVLEITDILISKCSQLGPLRVYAIGARYHFPDVMRAQAAARSVLTLPTSAANAYVEELEDISGGAYHRLFEYRRECVATLAEMAKDLTWLADGVWTFKEVSSDCTCVADLTGTPYHFKGASSGCVLSAWFTEHYQRIASLLQDRPCQEAIADEELCEQVLKEGSKCPRCREAVHYHMRLFQTDLKKEMSRRIAEISLKLH